MVGGASHGAACYGGSWNLQPERNGRSADGVDWLSIDTDMPDDPKIMHLQRKEGPEGCWFYQVLLADIASDIDFENERNGYLDTGGDSPVEYVAWRCRIDQEKAESFLDTCAEIGLICDEIWEENEVFVPKILERKQVKKYLARQESGSKGGSNGKTNKQTASKTEANGKQTASNRDRDKEEDKELDEQEDVSDQKDSDLPPPTPKQFREKWKEEMPSFVPMHITKKRRRKLRARRKENRFVENWETIIEKASQSQFLIENTSNGSGERTFFDATWLLENDENYTKVLEGKYDDQGQDVEEFGHLDAEYSGERRKKVKEAMEG